MDEQIKQLFELGHGMGTIAIVLKVKMGLVRDSLKRQNLRRTRAESYSLRNKNGISCKPSGQIKYDRIKTT